MIRKLLPAVCGVFALGIAIGCGSESVFAPPATGHGSAITAPARATTGSGDATDTVVALARRSPLDHDISATAVIGPAGGSITLDAAGATIVFPPGALDSPRQIKMTAKAGANVAYEFCPHGITFAVPVVVRQDLTLTQANANDFRTLQAGYFSRGLDAIFVDGAKSLAAVSEIRGVNLDTPSNPRIGTFYISHFSGYIVSTGFADGGGSDSSFAQP